MNQQNGTILSDMSNPNYQHPAPHRAAPVGALDETEEEYLNCFKNPVASSPPTLPEYLNTSQTPLNASQTRLLPPSSSSLFRPNGHGLIGHGILNNPDYQQDFCPLGVKPKTNGHLPAAENSEYLGVEVH